MPEFRNGRQVRFYITHYGNGYEINEATDLELAHAGIDMRRDVVGTPLDNLQEAQEKLALYEAQRKHL